MVVVKHNQAIVDISMQEFGSADYVFDIAVLNGMAITDRLTAGSQLMLPVINNTTLEKEISLLLKKRMNSPASDDNDPPNQLPPTGIGYMRIIDPNQPTNNDFKVS